MLIEIRYQGKLLGLMDKHDSRRFLYSTNDGYMAFQAKYQTKYGIDDMLDFVSPEVDHKEKVKYIKILQSKINRLKKNLEFEEA